MANRSPDNRRSNPDIGRDIAGLLAPALVIIIVFGVPIWIASSLGFRVIAGVLIAGAAMNYVLYRSRK